MIERGNYVGARTTMRPCYGVLGGIHTECADPT